METLIVSEPGIALQNRRGSLYVREPIGAGKLYKVRVHGLKSIVIAGHGASITSEAIRWCAREGVSLYVMERAGECMTFATAAAECDCRRAALTVRQKQFAAVLDPRRRLDVARKIVSMKLLTLALTPRGARKFKNDIRAATKVEDLLVAEMKAGAVYFIRWRGSEMRFKDDAPECWRAFVARAGSMLKGRGGMSRARHSGTPIGAMLNYAYIVTLGQVTRAIVGAGLDACHGFLHAPKRGRLSLSYDLMEFHRTRVTERVFKIAGERSWTQDDFELDGSGVVRLTAGLAREIAAVALRVTPVNEAVRSVKCVIRWL